MASMAGQRARAALAGSSAVPDYGRHPPVCETEEWRERFRALFEPNSPEQGPAAPTM